MISKSTAFLLVKLIRTPGISNSRKFSTEPSILTKEVGNNAMIVLNRPKSLNAIITSQQLEMLKTLKHFEDKKSLLILKGAGDKGFSAGGDLLEIKKAASRNDKQYMHDLMTYLNANIYLLHKFKIPTVSLMDGITFGAGVGVSVFTKYKIVTEKTKFSMPEAKIAFHPNSAATYFFNRSSGKLGYYLSLTGNTLTGSDVVRAGFATHFCDSKNLKILEEELLNSFDETDAKNIIENICQAEIPEFSLTPVIDKMNTCFAESTVEEIISKLKQDGSSWAKETLDVLNRYSPTSLKVILRQLQMGKDMNLADCLVMESNLSINFYKYQDIYEGTRITLEDRNDSPKWNPSKLRDVTEELIEGHFVSIMSVDEALRKLFAEIDSSR